MSIVCGKVDKDEIVVAADSGSFIGDSVVTNSNTHKLFKISRYNMIVGGVGLVSETKLFERFLYESEWVRTAIEKKFLGEDFLFDVMIKFYRYLQEVKDAAPCLDRHEDGEPHINGFLIACQGALYECAGMDVNRVTDYSAIGVGTEYAIAAMECGKSPVEAAELAMKHHAFIKPPIYGYRLLNGGGITYV